LFEKLNVVRNKTDPDGVIDPGCTLPELFWFDVDVIIPVTPDHDWAEQETCPPLLQFTV
jgi:hypothetical protein